MGLLAVLLVVSFAGLFAGLLAILLVDSFAGLSEVFSVDLYGDFSMDLWGGLSEGLETAVSEVVVSATLAAEVAAFTVAIFEGSGAAESGTAVTVGEVESDMEKIRHRENQTQRKSDTEKSCQEAALNRRSAPVK